MDYFANEHAITYSIVYILIYCGNAVYILKYFDWICSKVRGDECHVLFFVIIIVQVLMFFLPVFNKRSQCVYDVTTT